MNRKLLITVFIPLATASMLTMENAGAQSFINIDASQQVTNFRFYDSDGQQDDAYKPIYAGAYSIGYTYEFDFGLILNATAGMRKAGSTMVYDAANYRWDFQYLNTGLGAGYGYNLGRFKPYLLVSGYFGYLLKANQRVNNEDFDIIDSESIKRDDAGICFSPGVKVTLSDAVSVYAEFNYLWGLRNIETGADAQKSNNFAYAVKLGLSFSIQKL